jgi:PadR family transcriptional regulator, regulatory protein PadR
LGFGNWEIQLRKGVLDLAIMNQLRRKRSHGYDLVQELKKMNGLEMREGNIYAILTRLAAEGLVKSKTEPSRDGPPRKYFELTATGENLLKEMNLHWDSIMRSIDHIRRG